MESLQAGDIIVSPGSQKHDPAWKHCQMIQRGERILLRCLYCHKLFSGGGIHRIKEHLACMKGNSATCARVHADVRRAMQQSIEAAAVRRKKTSLPLPLLVQPPKRKKVGKASPEEEQVPLAVARFFYEAEVPLEAADSAYFRQMIDAIAAAGAATKLPSFDDLRGSLLKSSLGEIKSALESFKETWGKTGCSLLADEWVDDKDRTLINFLVYSPAGLVFLKSVDASQLVTSPEALCELLKLAVEEVGAPNVVQVVTHCTETHALAGKMLSEAYPSLFWSPCAARCLDRILQDIAELEPARSVLDRARSLTRFLYGHAGALNMTRRITQGEELVFFGRTPAETAFGTLRLILASKEKLLTMVTSEEWNGSSFSRSPAAVEAARLVCSQAFWSSLEPLVYLVKPLLKLLRMADNVERPAMGYLYCGLQGAEETMKRLVKRKREFLPLWNVVEGRWPRELRGGLQAAGFFLNPQLFYSLKGEVPNEVMTGVLDCVERLVPDINSQDRINKELAAYKNSSGDFGRKMAIRARQTLLPGEWWSTYGGACPNLARLAIRILSQTCGAHGWERDRRPFEEMHSQGLNPLEEQRLSDLIFVRYNLRLQQRHLVKRSQRDPLSAHPGDGVDDWTVDRNNVLGSGEASSWMELNQPMLPYWGHTNASEDDVFTNGFEEDCIHSDEDGGEEDAVYGGSKESAMVYVKQDEYGFVKDDE